MDTDSLTPSTPEASYKKALLSAEGNPPSWHSPMNLRSSRKTEAVIQSGGWVKGGSTAGFSGGGNNESIFKRKRLLKPNILV